MIMAFEALKMQCKSCSFPGTVKCVDNSQFPNRNDGESQQREEDAGSTANCIRSPATVGTSTLAKLDP